jgi:hypothetical protein
MASGISNSSSALGVNTPNDATISNNPPIDFNSIANSLSYISAQTPAAGPLVNMLTQQIANYAGNWKYYQQNVAAQTAGMPTGQAMDFMAQQGLQYSMQSLQQLQNLITGILPYMSQAMVLQFQDKWFQQEQKMKQAQMQAEATSGAYAQLNNPNGAFSLESGAKNNAATDAANNANQPGVIAPLANPQTAQQAAAQYMQGKVFQGMGQNGMANFIDPNTGNVSSYSFDPNAPQGTNPFTQSSNLTAGQLGSSLSQLATQGSNNALMQAGYGTGGQGQTGTLNTGTNPSGGGASLGGTTPSGASTQSPYSINQLQPNSSLFGTQTGQAASTGGQQQQPAQQQGPIQPAPAAPGQQQSNATPSNGSTDMTYYNPSTSQSQASNIFSGAFGGQQSPTTDPNASGNVSGIGLVKDTGASA